MVYRGMSAAIICALLVCSLAGYAVSEIRPSFDLDVSAWSATHVVVATEGDTIDGRFTVIESWVGALEVGAELQLPTLATFAPIGKRRVHEDFTVPEDGPVVTGRRMVLFLKREPTTDTWRPASPWGDVDASVCWIENGEAYGLVQIINPGAPVLVRLETNEAAVRARVQEMRKTRQALDEIRRIGDPGRRATAAAAHVDAGPYVVVNEVFEILEGCGRAAVPQLLALAQQQLPGRFRWQAFEALGSIGDPAAVKPLVEMLEQELDFWTDAGKRLERGWWNGKGLEWKQVEHYRVHYSRVIYPLRALAGIAAPGYEDVVRKTRALWSSVPALHEVGNAQVEEHCDDALKALDEAPLPPK